MMDQELLEQKVTQAEEQLAFWEHQRDYAAQQALKWIGALGALRDLQVTANQVEQPGDEAHPEQEPAETE